MKFNLIIGNPPYQSKDENGVKKNVWPKFVSKLLEYLQDAGYMSLIHPAKWRAPENKLWKELNKYQIEYLELHPTYRDVGRESGQEIFGVLTSFDWYILQKISPYKKTTVNDFDGKNFHMNLKDWPWLPSGKIDTFKKLLATDDDITVNIVTNKRYSLNEIKEKQDSKFKYSVIKTIRKNDKDIFYSDNNKKGYFGISKIIISQGLKTYTFEDLNGEYGISSHTGAILIENEKETKLLIKTLNSKKFGEIIKYSKWSNFTTELKMFIYFKKDFWKYFVDENGNEI
jgi:hypothetical protein